MRGPCENEHPTTKWHLSMPSNILCEIIRGWGKHPCSIFFVFFSSLCSFSSHFALYSSIDICTSHTKMCFFGRFLGTMFAKYGFYISQSRYIWLTQKREKIKKVGGGEKMVVSWDVSALTCFTPSSSPLPTFNSFTFSTNFLANLS